MLLLQVKKAFKGIDNIIIKSLQSVQKIIINDKHCFEMYGYDVLFDSDLKPWVPTYTYQLAAFAQSIFRRFSS